MRERRQRARAPTEWWATLLLDGAPIRGKVFDASTSGIFMGGSLDGLWSSDAQRLFGRSVAVNIVTDGRPQGVDIAAVIRWIGYSCLYCCEGAGLELVSPHLSYLDF